MSQDFDDEWSAALPMVTRYVRGMVRDPELAEDVLQESHVRAWRGWRTYQGRSSFRTWAIAIARNEALRILQRADRRHDAERLADVAEPVAPEPPAPPDPTALGLVPAIAEAVEAGLMSQVQADVLAAYLAAQDGEPGVRDRAAEGLGMTPGNFAVAQFRAMQDLRLYLLVARRDLLGGTEAIERAFALARERPVDPLTDDESAAFRRAVLDASAESAKDRVRGLLRPLRSACMKVALHLRL